ncbi:MAG TPA: RNA 2',3'-cyclic phosphodiesterase [Polyangia bacterium]|nr:RNA 2',3'-cyclic phosphodiesterase [Polyangia bacterium]
MTGTPATRPLRSFVAVALPEEVRARVFAAAGEMATSLPPAVRWTRKIENLHVTVKFLGPVEEERLASFGAALSASFASTPPFDITVRGMGAFPSARHANVLWAGVDDASGRLAATAAIIEAAAARLRIGEPSILLQNPWTGSEPPALRSDGQSPSSRHANRPFRAHVTVGRSKVAVDARAALAAMSDRLFGDVPVGAFCVYESQLGGGPHNAGSTYVLRHTAALGSN